MRLSWAAPRLCSGSGLRAKQKPRGERDFTGIGSLLGAAMGLVPALALSANPDLPFAAPWMQIALTVVVLPVVIAAGSLLPTMRSTLSARRMATA
jgi:hypothetical protein